MKTLSRYLALWLILALGLPSPALALRATGLEESNQQPVLREALGGVPTLAGGGLLARVQGWYALHGAWGPTRQLLRRIETLQHRTAIRASLIRFAKWLAFHHRMNPRGVLRFGLPIVNELSADPPTIPQHLVALEWLAARLAEQRIYPASYAPGDSDPHLIAGIIVAMISVLGGSVIMAAAEQGDLPRVWGEAGVTVGVGGGLAGLVYAVIGSDLLTRNPVSEISSTGSGVPTIILNPAQFAQLTAAAMRYHAAPTDFQVTLLTESPKAAAVAGLVLDVSIGEKRHPFFLYLRGTGTPLPVAGPQIAAHAKAQLAGLFAEMAPGIVVDVDPWLDRVAETLRQLRERHTGAGGAYELVLQHRDAEYTALAGLLHEAGIIVPPSQAADTFDQILQAVAVLRPANIPQLPTAEPAAPMSAPQPLPAPPATALLSSPASAAPDAAAEPLRRAPDRQRQAGLEEKKSKITPEQVQILIVEDDQKTRGGLLRTIKGAIQDYRGPKQPLVAQIRAARQIHAVASGPDAQRLIRQHKPQLILTDLHIRKGTGFEVAEEAKRVEKGATVILIGRTVGAFENSTVQQYLKRRTFDAWIDKGLLWDDMPGVLEKHLIARLTAGLEEDPIAAALTQGPVTVDVDDNSVARINGQGEPITIPDELRRPGFFDPGSRTILARFNDLPIPSDVMLMDQLGIPGAPGSLSTFGVFYQNLTQATTSVALRDGLLPWRNRSDLVALFQASLLPLETAEVVRRKWRHPTFIGAPDGYIARVDELLPLIRAAQSQHGILYFSKSLAVTYRGDRVLLIAA